MNNTEITEGVVDALLQVAPETDIRTLDPAVSFRDQFEIDSVDFLNFVLTLEKKLDTKIPAMDFPKLSSLDGFVDYLTKQAEG